MLTDDDIKMIARVIYSEASPICDYQEREFVASVIANRRKHPGFGRGKFITMYDVVMQPRAFSCIGDELNTNWTESEFFNIEFDWDDERYSSAWKESVRLALGNFLCVDDIVYYHDRSIQMPTSWNNKWWEAIPMFGTRHFVFYRVKQRS